MKSILVTALASVILADNVSEIGALSLKSRAAGVSNNTKRHLTYTQGLRKWLKGHYFAEGDEILSNFKRMRKNGKIVYFNKKRSKYSGIITQVNTDGTYNIEYADGAWSDSGGFTADIASNAPEKYISAENDIGRFRRLRAKYIRELDEKNKDIDSDSGNFDRARADFARKCSTFLGDF